MYYAAADLFLFPSLYDNAPLVVREAAAMHTPSLLTEVSTATEFICDEVNGFLTRNSKEAMAAKILRIIGDRILLQTVGDIAAEDIAQSWENIIEQVQQRYIGIMQRKMRELDRLNYHIPWPERIWSESVPDLY